MNYEKLNDLRIKPEQKGRSGKTWVLIVGAVLVLTAAAVFYAIPRSSDSSRLLPGQKPALKASAAAPVTNGQASGTMRAAIAAVPGETILTVSGYIVARERIELSPRFMGVVKWIGVKKGDPVTNNQVVVLLDDSEYQARLKETQGRLALAKANMEKAKLQYDRVKTLASQSVESKQMEDDMRLNVEAGKAAIGEIDGQIDFIQTYIDWCVIRAPINGVVLEKLVDPNELVTPQSFGGTRGPSTALIALADLKDLQVEIDLNEADVAKATLGQRCRVSPEAYPDHVYEGYVAEKAPEANRQKGTLQVKVQIRNPDKFLTPELTARVDFLKESDSAPSAANKPTERPAS